MALESGVIVGSWGWDVVNDRITTDARFARTFGLEPPVPGAQPTFGDAVVSIHPEDRDRVARVVSAVKRDGGRYRAEYRVRGRDGAYRWVEATGRCDLGADGRPARFPGVLIDIDDRKQAEERLQRSEAEARDATRLLRAVIESVPALIYVKDRHGRMQIANQAVLDLVGKPWPQVEARTDAEFLDDRAQGLSVMETDARVMRTGQAEELEEVVGYDSLGPRIWLSHKTAFQDEHGAVIGLVGTSVDISARKRTEQALAASKTQLLMMIGELNHRVKNLFTVACGMIGMEARRAETPRALADAVIGRLLALSRAHALIHPADHSGGLVQDAALDDLVRAIVAPHQAEEGATLSVAGPPVRLTAQQATAMALILYELATNAAKYGALSMADGQVAVDWHMEAGTMRLHWRESGGPAIAQAPERDGFGSRLARQTAAAQLGGAIDFDWAPTGVRVALTARLAGE